MRWRLNRKRARDPVVHVGDPRFDSWEVVRDFEDVATARAFRQQVTEAGIERSSRATGRSTDSGAATSRCGCRRAPGATLKNS
jgi:hypothetical protein